MILRNLFFQAFLLFFSTSDAAFTFTSNCKRDDFINESNGNRVKRHWTYPPIAINETIEGANFTSSAIFNISSSIVRTVRYELLDNSIGVRQGYFVLENINGKGRIWQMKGIDREIYPKLTIYVRALDATSQSAESEDAEIECIINDLNDNEPIFDPASLTGSVKETATVGQKFMQISATDADSSFNDYNKVRFAYVGNEHQPKADGSNRFSVSHSGQVSVASSLESEADGAITFLVRATDGLPLPSVLRHSTTGTVTVNILNNNHKTPSFTKNIYRKSIGELTKVGTTIVTVQADDNDEGVNKEFSFTTTNDINQQFSIQSDPNTVTCSSCGNVILEKPLDFENGPRFFILNITAYNKDAVANIDSLTATASVQINITDENEPPVFIDEPYKGFVMENIENGVRNVSKVKALDFDFGENQTISYALENALNWFEINEVNGEISSVTAVDREHVSVDQDTSQYLLRVTANDDGDPKLTSTATVTIKIGDKNDNAPVKGDGWNVKMCKNPPYAVRRNTSILKVKDDDSKLFAPFNFTKLNSEDWSVFDLKENFASYSAQLVIPITQNDYVFQKDIYDLPVQIVDTTADGQPAQTSTQTISIFICRCTDYDAQPECIDDVNIPDIIESLDEAMSSPEGGNNTPIFVFVPLGLLVLVLVIVVAVIALRHRRSQRNNRNSDKRERDRINKSNETWSPFKLCQQEKNEHDGDVRDSEKMYLMQDSVLITSNKQDIIPSSSNADLQPIRSGVDDSFTVNIVEENKNKLSPCILQEMPLSSQESIAAVLVQKKKTDILNKQQSKTKEQLAKQKNYEFFAGSFRTSINDADIVGVGGYGVVRRCVHSDLGEVVVKCMHCASSDDFKVKVAEVLKRVRVFAQFDHQFIVRFYGMTSWGISFGMVMEEVKCGNLHYLMFDSSRVTTIDWKLRFRIILQLANALEYLHFQHDPKKSYIHLDIKPENILMTEKLCVKLADFGALDIARATNANPTTNTDISSAHQYTLFYTAPERLRKLYRKVSTSMDVYSFAMICYDVITRKQAFSDVEGNQNLIRDAVASRGQKPNTKLISDVEQELKQKNSKDYKIFRKLKAIMEKCWCFEAKDRLSTNQICEKLSEFAGSDDPYEAELKSHIHELAKIILQHQKPSVTLEKKVPLECHFPPFDHATKTDRTSSSSVRFSSQTEKVTFSDSSLLVSDTTAVESISLSS